MLKRLAVSCVVVLVSAELLLQLGALVVALTVGSRSAGSGTADEHIVCVGDSYTYGVGASGPDGSYPGHLQRLLRAGGRSVDVTNAGWPGQDSSDVLRKVAGQLNDRTSTVCLLVGTNDSWRHPELVEQGVELEAAVEEEPAFVWRWRTGRLLAVLFRFETGAWERTGDVQAAELAGDAHFPEGGLRNDAETARLQKAAFGLLTKEGLLPEEPRKPVLPRNPPAPVRAAMRRVRKLLDAGEPGQALEVCRQVLAEHPDSGVACSHAAVAAARAGDREESDRALSELRALLEAGSRMASEDQLVWALWTCGHQEEALTLARARVVAQPGALGAWDVLARGTYAEKDPAEFERAVRGILALRGRDHPGNSGFQLRRLGRRLAKSEPAQAAQLLVAATVLDGRPDRTRLALQAEKRHLVTGDELVAAIDAYGETSDAVLGELRNVIDEVFGGAAQDAWRQVWSEHVRRIRDLTEAEGIDLVVLSYPFHQRALEETQRQIAEELGVPFVPVRERFAEALKVRDRNELFVSDGHCNDDGYALIAEEVVKVLGAAEAPPADRND